MKMAELVERYLEHRRPGMGEQTFKNYQSNLRRMAHEWDRTRRVATSIDEDWLGDYLSRFRRGEVGGMGRELSYSTYNKAVEQYLAFLTWAIRRGVSPLVLDACRRMPKQEPKEFLRLTAAQVVHMIETCPDPWERWVLAYASQTLGRDSELRNRQVRHLHLDRGTLDWYRKKTVDLDELPVTRQLAAEWDRWVRVYQDRCGSIQMHWPLVPARQTGWARGSMATERRWDGAVVAVKGARRAWHYNPARSPHALSSIVQKHASRASGLPQEALKGQGVHILRRSMARALYERLRDEQHPQPLRVVQAALGHADEQTTRIYIGVRPDRMERNALLMGSDLLWSPDQGNVVELRSVDHG